MSIGSKLLLLALAGLLGLVVLEAGPIRPAPEELTRLALRQLESSDAAAEELRSAEAAKNWWLLAWPVGLAALASVLFWDEVRAVLNDESKGG